MDLSTLLEDSSLHALCYIAKGKLRPQRCSLPKVVQHIRSVIFLSCGFLVSHPILVKSTAYSNHCYFFGKDIVLVFLKKVALTGLKATASSKVVGPDEDGSSL